MDCVDWKARAAVMVHFLALAGVAMFTLMADQENIRIREDLQRQINFHDYRLRDLAKMKGDTFLLQKEVERIKGVVDNAEIKPLTEAEFQDWQRQLRQRLGPTDNENPLKALTSHDGEMAVRSIHAGFMKMRETPGVYYVPTPKATEPD